MKTSKLWMLAVILTCGLQGVTLTSCVDSVDNPVPVNPGEHTTFTTKQLPVNRYGEAIGTVNVRFYDDMPSVPYISVADFQRLLKPGCSSPARRVAAAVAQYAHTVQQKG